MGTVLRLLGRLWGDTQVDFGTCSTATGHHPLGISGVLQTTCPLQLPLLSPQQPSGCGGWRRRCHCSRLTGGETEALRPPLVEGWSRAGAPTPPAPSLPACPGCAPGPHLVARGPHIRSLLPPSRPHPSELTVSWAEGLPIWQSFAIHQQPFPVPPCFQRTADSTLPIVGDAVLAYPVRLDIYSTGPTCLCPLPLFIRAGAGKTRRIPARPGIPASSQARPSEAPGGTCQLGSACLCAPCPQRSHGAVGAVAPRLLSW